MKLQKRLKRKSKITEQVYNQGQQDMLNKVLKEIDEYEKEFDIARHKFFDIQYMENKLKDLKKKLQEFKQDA